MTRFFVTFVTLVIAGFLLAFVGGWIAWAGTGGSILATVTDAAAAILMVPALPLRLLDEVDTTVAMMFAAAAWAALITGVRHLYRRWRQAA